jgi:hypothetical protein
LIDEVGYALYSRCRSIVHVSDAMLGRVHCARCDTIIQRQGNDPGELLQCPQCGWETCWKDYYATYHTQELGAAGAWDIFATFVAGWEAAHTPREKMLLIDQLIHRWHGETRRQRPKFGLGRPTGVNLIEGNRKQVLALLDTLSYGAGSTPGTQGTKAAWRGHWEAAQCTSTHVTICKRGMVSRAARLPAYAHSMAPYRTHHRHPSTWRRLMPLYPFARRRLPLGRATTPVVSAGGTRDA